MKYPDNHEAEALHLIEECKSNKSEDLHLAGLAIREIPESITQLATHLKRLTVSEGTSLRFAFTLPNLEVLLISGLKKQTRFSDPEYEKIYRTRYSTIRVQLPELQDLSFIENFDYLKSLKLGWCRGLADFSSLGKLKQLEDLALIVCEKLVDLLPLSDLDQLKSLNLGGCKELADLTPLASLGQLKDLDLNSCKELADLAPLASLGQLESLNLGGCRELTDLTPLASLGQLKDLDLNSCKELADLAPLASLGQLESLNLGGCRELTDLTPLASLGQLESLNLGSCSKLTDLTPLAGLEQLKSLGLGWCVELTDLTSLASLRQLESLNLESCWKLTDLTPLTGLGQLESLNLDGYDKQVDPALLTRLGQLKSLNLGGCKELADLTSLTGLEQLKSLGLSWCRELTDLASLASLGQLKSLNLDGCMELIDLTPLASLGQLESLNLGSCSKLTDLTPLAGLEQLKSLGLGWCVELTDLTSLASLRQLESLNLESCWKLTDLTPLTSLGQLKSLNLDGCMELIDLTPLASLGQLESLNLENCIKLTDLTLLAGLEQLKSLGLGWCRELTDLTSLASLRQLESLNLSGCNKLVDLTPLTGLGQLESLNLSGCDKLVDLTLLAGLGQLESLNLSDCDKLVDLTPLAGLGQLESLNLGGCDKLIDLTPLAGLEQLKSLGLSWCRELTDLTPLTSLGQLESLNLSSCDKLVDLTPLTGLGQLENLKLNGCGKIVDFSALNQLFKLRRINLYNISSSVSFSFLKRLKGLIASNLLVDTWRLPRELLSKDEYADSCVNRCLDYVAALKQGSHQETLTKAFLLGNGEVGKTQLRRRLQGLPFDPNIPSTHGVEIIEPDALEHDLPIQIWDFGGQDIYHSTHALFLKASAVFILLWNPRSEEKGEFEQDGILVRNERLPYWLEYIGSQTSNDSPVLCVQSQCKARADTLDPPLGQHTLGSRLNHFAFGATTWSEQDCPCDPEEDPPYNLEVLVANLKQAVLDLRIHEPYPDIPDSFLTLREKMRDLRKKGIKRISLDEYKKEAEKAGCATYSETTLYLLHHTGVIFHDGELIKDQIIVDQNWALSPIYDLFHRKDTLKHLRDYKKGYFIKDELANLRWNEQNYSSQEQDLFLKLMTTCQLCFPVGKTPFDETIYLAPDLLPEENQIKSLFAPNWPEDHPITAWVHFKFVFFHRGLLHRLFSNLNNLSDSEPHYWRSGCLFWHPNGGGYVKLDLKPAKNGSATLSLQCKGDHPAKFIHYFKQQVAELAPEKNYKIEESDELEDPSDSNVPEEEEQKEVILANAPNKQPEAFISYAWGDDTALGRRRNQAVDTLEEKLKNQGYIVHRDSLEIKNRSLISNYIEKLTKAPLIFLIISDKYLRSEYCMYELLRIYQTSQQDKETFLSRVVPLILSDARIATMREKNAYAEHWFDECDPIRKSVVKRGGSFAYLGTEGSKQYRYMDQFADQVFEILTHLNDILIPRGLEFIKSEGMDSFLEDLRNELEDADEG